MFIRVETDDTTKRSILIDETMTVAQICDILAVKSRTRPNLKWSIVEQLTDLYMGQFFDLNSIYNHYQNQIKLYIPIIMSSSV